VTFPAAYESEPGFEFVKAVPTIWDETKVLDASIGNFITIARRKNNDWYIGTITNGSSRETMVDLSFLADGNYEAELYSDAPDSEQNPNHLLKQIKMVTNRDKTKCSCSSRRR
jgi:alpha-glucosidase